MLFTSVFSSAIYARIHFDKWLAINAIANRHFKTYYTFDVGAVFEATGTVTGAANDTADVTGGV